MPSQKLASGENLLKGELAAAWNILEGSSGDYTDLGVARRFGGASAAYSLRDIGAMNGPVVNVRREPHDDDNPGVTDETDFSANQVQSGVLEDWVNGKLETTLPADVATASAAYSLRKVKAGYGIPVTKISSANIFPTSLTTSGQNILTSDGSNSGFNIRDFEQSDPTSSSSTINGNSWTVEATFSGSAKSFGKAVRIFGLEDNKQYTVKGEFRMVTDTTSGGDSLAVVDISDNTAGTDEDSVSTSSTTFVPFLIDAGYNSGANHAFVDFTVSTVGSETGTITAEFRNVQIIENNNSAVRIRRSSDNVEVIVGFDSDDKVSASSAITNVSEEGGESGQTTATTLGGFINSSEDFSDFKVDSEWSDNLASFSSVGKTSFSVQAKSLGSFNSTDTVRVSAPITNIIAEPQASVTKFKTTFTIDSISGEGNGNDTDGALYIKGANSPNGNGSWNFHNSPDGAGGNVTFKFTSAGTYTVEGYGEDETDAYNLAFKTFSFIIYSGTQVSVSNVSMEVLNDCTVHTWYDQAGVNNAVQATAANQPKIAESGALLADGLKFNGNSDNFTITNGVSGRSIFAVTNQNIDTTGGGLTGYGQDGISSLLGTAGTNSYIFISNNNSAFNSYAISIDGAGTSDTGKYASNGKTLSSAGGNLGTYGDIPSDTNSLLSIIYNSGDPAFDWTRLGSGISGNIFMQGSMSEVILYTSDQTDNRFKIESNINNYYGLYNDANEFSGNPVAAGGASAAITLTNESKTGFTAQIDATSGTKQINFPLLNSLVSGNDYFVSFDYTSTSTSTVGVKPRTAALGSASNDVISATNSRFYGGTGDSQHNGFDVNNTATVLSFQTTAQSFTFTVSNLRVSRIARNGLVETWYDQSGNGNNATQATANNQPKIVVNGGIVTLENGTPSLGFNRSGGLSQLVLASGISNEPYTFFATTVHNGSFYFRIFAENNSAPSVFLNSASGGSISYKVSDSDDSGQLATSAIFSDNIVSGFSGANGGADGIVRINGTNLKTDISRTQAADSITHIGRFPNTSVGFAHIESLVIYESDLSADFDTIEKELAQPINIL